MGQQSAVSALSIVAFQVNGRSYHLPPRPLVAICLDGSSNEYLTVAMAHGRMPNLQRIIQRGHHSVARAALPSFTNVNNASIVTGTPPSIHGICGNFFLDPVSGQEVMMNSSAFLRAETILAAAAQAGRKVAMITAKEKIRDILSHQLKGIAFSSEQAQAARLETHGIDQVEKLVGEPAPNIYSAQASLFVLRAGLALLNQQRADFLFLSLTDYIQHRFPPAAPEAIDFYGALDEELGRFLKTDAILGITSDHGMNAKQLPDGQPNVIYLESLLSAKFDPDVRVILPITDPYPAHHGALGSFAVIHLSNPNLTGPVQNWLLKRPGLSEVYDRPTAVRKLELPSDRTGDLVALARRDVVIGRTPQYHELEVLQNGLRSHGGRYEEMVPFIISHPLKPDYLDRAAADLRNFDLFDFLTNGVQLPGLPLS